MKTYLLRRSRFTGFCAAMVGLCLALSAQAADVKKIMIRFPGTLPVAHHVTKSQEFFKKLVEERSGGRIVVQVYPAGQLYKDVDLVDVIPKGSVEMAVANLGQWTGLIPQVSIFDFTGLWENREHFYRVQDDPVVRDLIAKAMAQKNTFLLNTIDYGEGSFITNKPLKKLEDFKGMRIRASTEYTAMQVQALGGASSLISSSEMYQGLSLGTIDGATTGPSSFLSRKLYEVAKFDMRDTQVMGDFGIVVNLKWWNGLPTDMKELLQKAGRETELWCRKAAQEADAQAWEKLSAIPGNVVYRVDRDELTRWAKLTVAPQAKLLKERIGKDADVMLERVEALRKQ